MFKNIKLFDQLNDYVEKLSKMSNTEKDDKNEYEIQKLIKVSQQIGQKNTLQLYQYPLYKRDQLTDVETYKSMIVIGQTGSGKTTLLNFFLNYYLEVQFTDNFRFILINEQQQTSQAMGQTQVNIYYVQPFNGKCGIRLIDTPGFGDPRGLIQDEIIGNKIKKCFKEDVESLSAVCFLVQSSNARLTPNQNYILNCILSMFGNDIIQNFVFMLTFCDAENLQALEALKFIGQGKIPCSPVAGMVGKIKEPWYLKLNSSAFISPNRQEVITKYYWEIAMTSFGEFYHKKLMKNISQSLILTKEVIRERDEIITIIQNIRPKIEQQLNQIKNIKNTHSQIQFLDSKIVDSQNFKIKSQKLVIEKELLKQGEYITNCIICNVTCHYPCGIPLDDDKASCSAMKDNYCQQCDSKCIWSSHKNMTFRYISKSQDVDIELEELKKLYLDSKSKKTLKQQILDGIENQYMQQQIECMDLQQNLMTSVNRLKKIALQPGCCEFQEDYVEIMIKEETFSKREGFLNRITELMDIKSNWKYIREISNDLGGIKITSQFIRTHIPKEKIKENLFQKAKQLYNRFSN